jgi:hypothetical protein
MTFDARFPGSQDARDAGCRCPLMDNGYGDPGLAKDRGGWVVNGSCPLHGFASDQAPEGRLSGTATSVAPGSGPAAMQNSQQSEVERVTCPACNGSQRDLRATAPGHKPKDHGPCWRCRGFGTVIAANLNDARRDAA